MKRLRFEQLLIIGFSLLILLFSGCNKTETDDPIEPFGVGVFVVCEGPFQIGTGTISFFDRFYKTVQQDIFQKVNSRPLGNIVQSMSIFNGKGYIVVNKGAKVEVIEANSFKSDGVINGFTSPRYFLGISNTKGYVSDWANNIAVVNLATLSIIKTIPTGTGPENMIAYADKVFVLNKGGFNFDSTITVIDSKNDNVIKTIQISHVPAGICLDKFDKLWILCSGKGWNGYPMPTDTKGHLVCLNPNDYSIEKDIEFPSNDKHPDKLIINNTKDVLYYNYTDGIYAFNVSSDNLNTIPLIKSGKQYYGLAYDYAVNMIYGTDPVDNVQNGWVFRFNANNGMKVDSFKVGVVPGNFCFN